MSVSVYNYALFSLLPYCILYFFFSFSLETLKSSVSTKNCPSTSAGVPSQCDDTHSNHDSSDDNQSSDGSQSTQDTCLVPDQRLFMSSKS